MTLNFFGEAKPPKYSPISAYASTLDCMLLEAKIDFNLFIFGTRIVAEVRKRYFEQFFFFFVENLRSRGVQWFIC